MANPDYGLGRRPEFDERSRSFPVRALAAAQKPPRSYTWGCGLFLNQGSEGACVGFSWAHELAARPVEVAQMNYNQAMKIYKTAQTIDEWPGENYSGTSVLAGAKVAQSLGYIDEYRWAFGVDDLAVAVSRVGPAVIGIKWYEGMFEPDERGYISPTGQLAGGHAILVRGYNVQARRFLLHNSWGQGWGRAGTCWITHADLRKLLSENGDACIPIKRAKGQRVN